MNKYKKALNYFINNMKWVETSHRRGEAAHKAALTELVDRATPIKLTLLPISELDESIMPPYTYKVDKVMCPRCGLTSFVVDNHYSTFKFCNCCGQEFDGVETYD